jgi:endonuclease/exonuclease/phosphatase family metal-dependent hydrolase
VSRRLLLVVSAVALVVVVAAVTFVVRDEPAAPPGTTRSPRTDPTTTSTRPEPQPTPGAPTLTPCPTGEGRRLTVVTMNIHFARSRDGRLDLAQVARELDSWRPDVVLLQEVDRGRFRSGRVDQARRLGRRLGMEVALGLNRKVAPGASGNAILSRLPILERRNTRLPWRPGEIRRGLLRATVAVDGRPVDLFVTHLEPTSTRARRVQSRAVAERVLRSRRPVVLGGDLNTMPDRPPVEGIVRAGLVDAWAVAGRGPGLTVPAGSPRRRIDYVFAGGAFRVRSAEVLLSLVSDHRPVRAKLTLLPPRCR